MQRWIETEKKAVAADNRARRSQRQKESVLTYLLLRRLNDVDHKRILDGLYALGYTSDDVPGEYELNPENGLGRRWDRLFNRNQVLNERSECFSDIFPYLY